MAVGEVSLIIFGNSVLSCDCYQTVSLGWWGNAMIAMIIKFVVAVRKFKIILKFITSPLILLYQTHTHTIQYTKCNTINPTHSPKSNKTQTPLKPKLSVPAAISPAPPSYSWSTSPSSEKSSSAPSAANTADKPTTMSSLLADCLISEYKYCLGVCIGTILTEKSFGHSTLPYGWNNCSSKFLPRKHKSLTPRLYWEGLMKISA